MVRIYVFSGRTVDSSFSASTKARSFADTVALAFRDNHVDGTPRLNKRLPDWVRAGRLVANLHRDRALENVPKDWAR